MELLCLYYDFLWESSQNPDRSKSPEVCNRFWEQLTQKAETAKVSQKRKQPVLESLRQAGAAGLTERTPDFWNQITRQVTDLYAYAASVQFLYNMGYPLPLEGKPGSKKKPQETAEESLTLVPRRQKARTKTVPLKLLDYYFKQKGLALDEISTVNRMSPGWIANHEELKEKLEDVYDFACDNQMSRAVIPLLLDQNSGAGLYILGETYLQSWTSENRGRQRVEEILGGRPCCYAIVRFWNLELQEDNQYVWAPYSIVNPFFGTYDTNPEEILFHDLDTALNIYCGQLRAAPEVLYENFQNENLVHLQENAIPIPKEFRKYFLFSEEEEDSLEEEILRFQAEYQRQLPHHLSRKNGSS